jgi:hypothetical protein
VHSKENNDVDDAEGTVTFKFDLVEILGKIISKTNKPYHLIIPKYGLILQ